MRSVAFLLATALLATSAMASEDEDERYLLGDYGVRIELPDTWRSLEWSDAHFEAERDGPKLKLFAWGEVMQVPPTVDTLDVWADTYRGKIAGIGGSDAELITQTVTTMNGRPVARYELTFKLGPKLSGVMSGATFAVEGRMFHAAVIGAAGLNKRASDELDALVSAAEVRRPAVEAPSNQAVSEGGISFTLPDGWRAPIGAEIKPVASQAKKLGVEDLTQCVTALRPHPGDDPDVLVSCPAGMLVGVVDEYSFDGVAAIVKDKLLGHLPTDPPRNVVGDDGRTGLVFAASGEGSTLRVGVMPFGEGLAVTRVFGPSHQEADFDKAVDHVLSTGTFTGDHPVGLADEVSYYLTYRPTSPVVLIPGLLLLGLIGGGLFLATRGRSSAYDIDDL